MISAQTHYGSLAALMRSLRRNQGLLWQLTKREVVGRYRGSVMGMAWSFFNPLLMLAVYTFVFSVVFKTRWDVDMGEGKTQFAIVLFVGMIIHNLFSEVINRAPGLMLGNVNYVKKVVFPLELLPVTILGAAFFHALISLIALLVVFFLSNGFLQTTALFFPVILFPLVIATLGFAWMLASLGVFVRDVGQTVGIITTILLFVSPIFYPVSALPESFRPWLLANPLTFIIEQARAVLVYGQYPDWSGLALYAVASMVIAWAGFWWFQKTRKGFADVL